MVTLSNGLRQGSLCSFVETRTERKRIVDIEKLKEQLISDPEVMRLVTQRAFEIYLERRNRYVAHPAEDWLRAESEVLPRLINQMVERNRQAIASKDDADPVSSEAARHMREETSKAAAEPAVAKKASTKNAVKKAVAKPATAKAAAKKDAAKPAAKAAAKPAARKAAKPAVKATAKPAEKKAASPKPSTKAPAKKTAARPKKGETP